jgi:hypothetical protein
MRNCFMVSAASSASLFEPAAIGVSLGRRTSLPEIDIVLQVLLDVSSRFLTPARVGDSSQRRDCDGSSKVTVTSQFDVERFAAVR